MLQSFTASVARVSTFTPMTDMCWDNQIWTDTKGFREPYATVTSYPNKNARKFASHELKQPWLITRIALRLKSFYISVALHLMNSCEIQHRSAGWQNTLNPTTFTALHVILLNLPCSLLSGLFSHIFSNSKISDINQKINTKTISKKLMYWLLSCFIWAPCRLRSRDLLITSEWLYQLS